MIKSLLGEDENTENKESPDKKGGSPNSTQNSIFPTEDINAQKTKEITTQNDIKTDDTVVDTPSDEIETIDEIKTAIETGNIPPKQNTLPTVKPFEVDKPIGQPIIERDLNNEQTKNKFEDQIKEQEKTNSSRTLELEKKLREIEEELKKEKEAELQRLKQEVAEKVKLEKEKKQIQRVEPLAETEAETVNSQTSAISEGDWSDWGDSDKEQQREEDKGIQVKPKDYVPEPPEVTIRNMGMAWSAAIAWFGAVIVMLIIGWFADLLLGTSPWGIVVGIVLGSIIGLIQFVRTTSQIVNPKPNDFDKVSLKSNIDSVENSTSAQNDEDNTPTDEETELLEKKENEMVEKFNESEPNTDKAKIKENMENTDVLTPKKADNEADNGNV